MNPVRMARSRDRDKGPFIASRVPIRNRFHRWDCKWVKKMELKNRLMFKTHKDAVAAGRRPCLTCRP
jgi:methylphosphotriester-DNA--protein-cysteine methyltransferase